MSQPCENGGICIDLVGGFRCECPVEWTGVYCNEGKFLFDIILRVVGCYNFIFCFMFLPGFVYLGVG